MVDYWLAGHSVDDHPHSRSCGCQDGGGGVEVLPLEHQSAHVAGPSCRYWGHS
ncbi:unnamed protein product, partial [Closterium sp. NIES-64]